MNNTELRIGNYVTDVDGSVTRIYSGTDIDDLWTVVPLTEEWLLKLGFRKFVNDFSLKGVVIHSRKRGYVIRKSIPVMTSVHMLQNYFYAATGQELLIDQITIK